MSLSLTGVFVARRVWEASLAVGVQSLMLFQVSVAYGLLRMKHFLTRRRPYLYDIEDEEEESLGMVSVIIPAYRERLTIGSTLRSVAEAARTSVEVIVVDAGGNDGTIDVAREEAAKLDLTVKFTESRGGRGPAVAAGARLATGDILLILHADTRLPPSFDAKVRELLRDRRTLATAFRFSVRRGHFDILPFRIMELTVRLRSTVLQLPFGDQALALRKQLFKNLGGFDDLARVPILEDILLVQRLRILGARGKGTIREVPGPPAECDPRRWLTSSVWRVNLTNQVILFLQNFAGYDPAAIFQLYYGRKPTDT